MTVQYFWKTTSSGEKYYRKEFLNSLPGEANLVLPSPKKKLSASKTHTWERFHIGKRLLPS